ncbi:hypothetical protein, partial [Hymenobacter glacialis]|uniref:hypothetical protein n=1 Tax=Hymenobacter glacialis TaxID=1908236 RepID=UPI000ADF0798
RLHSRAGHQKNQHPLNGATYLGAARKAKIGTIVAGYANRRQVELLVEAGFTAVQAIKKISTPSTAPPTWGPREKQKSAPL